MAPLLQLFPIIFSLLILSSQAQPSFRPRALVLPVTKDPNTLQYVTTITQRTPPVPVELVVDLGGQFVWIDCQNGYVSSSYRPARCNSAQCSRANANPGCSDCTNPPAPGCNNNTCELSPQNPITEFITNGYVSMDALSLRSTDGYTPGNTVTVPQFIFACTRTFLLEGLVSGAQGIAGLGRTRIALPSQLAAAFSFDRKFAICLSPATSEPGVIFFGDGPYSFMPDSDVSDTFVYTRLLSNPVSTNGVALRGEGSFEYFIGVTSITIGGNTLPINASLLRIDGNSGAGGTKFSTVAPYSILETSIYNAFTQSFIRAAAAMNITRVASVAPFGACFSSSSIVSIRGRLQVPGINLVLSNNVIWPIYATNALVLVTNDVYCLGFVDANSVEDVANNPRAAIVLGGHQLENYFIQFDLATSRVGFTSILYDYTASCSAFRSTV